MPSIKDVARYCGVSCATVSNVINNKGNVGESTREKIEEAIEVLHYIPHAGARTLKADIKNVIGVIIPSIDDPYLARFYMGLQESLLYNKYVINLIITDHIASIENQALDEMLKQRIAGLILMSCQPENRDAFQLLQAKKIPLVLVDRNIDIKNANYVSFDYKNIGKYLCTSLLEKQYTHIALITGPSSYTSERDFIAGFSSAYKDKGQSIDDLIIVKSVYNRFGAFKSMIEILNYQYGIKLPDIVVTSNKILYDGAHDALVMQSDQQKKNIDIITLEEENWLEAMNAEKLTTVYRPAKKLGTIASELLVENITAQKIHTPKTRILEFYDLVPEETKQTAIGIKSVHVDIKKQMSLSLFMLQDNSTWAIRSLIPHFKYTVNKDIDVNIREFKYEELYQQIIDSKSTAHGQLPMDIVMIDNFWFSYLVKHDYLVELSEFFEQGEDVKAGFIPKVFEDYSMYNGQYFALPFNFIVQLLFYRKDLFNNERIKRNFYKMYGVELKVPKTWDEYNAIAEFFTKEYNGESPIQFGNTATGTTSTICDYLPRMWAYGGSVFDRNGNISIESHEAVEALKSYIRSFAYAPPSAINQWYYEEVEEFAQGNAAMMINFIAHTAPLIDLEYSTVAGKFGVSELPGGYPVLSGWSLGIHRGSLHREVAYEFIRWATSSKIAIPYTILGGCTPRSSLNQTEEILSLYPYFIFAEEQFLKSRKRTYPFDEVVNVNISDREFEVIIHKSIKRALIGELTPEDALKTAADELRKYKSAD